jgi:UDP-N-acetylmuramoyl-tripeptide--D-alanyl-D-alanine ligase
MQDHHSSNKLFSAEEIIEITQGRLACGLMPDEAGSICTDTRIIQEGQWFLALCGKFFDGHDFIGDAFAGGAIGCIVEARANYPIGNQSFPLIAVDDTAAALIELS